MLFFSKSKVLFEPSTPNLAWDSYISLLNYGPGKSSSKEDIYFQWTVLNRVVQKDGYIGAANCKLQKWRQDVPRRGGHTICLL